MTQMEVFSPTGREHNRHNYRVGILVCGVSVFVLPYSLLVWSTVFTCVCGGGRECVNYRKC